MEILYVIGGIAVIVLILLSITHIFEKIHYCEYRIKEISGTNPCGDVISSQFYIEYRASLFTITYWKVFYYNEYGYSMDSKEAIEKQYLDRVVDSEEKIIYSKQ